MLELVAMIQTSWPKIRVGLYKNDDGRFRFIEEGLHLDENGVEAWVHYHESGIYDDAEGARTAMIQHYCNFAEDEYRVDPESVTVLEAPDFEGIYHPQLILR